MEEKERERERRKLLLVINLARPHKSFASTFACTFAFLFRPRKVSLATKARVGRRADFDEKRIVGPPTITAENTHGPRWIMDYTRPAGRPIRTGSRSWISYTR
jgi:hypothetical protein